MRYRKHFLRSILFLFLLTCLLNGLGGTGTVPAHAAPLQAPAPPHVVISEFRFLGPQGGNDEFIELYNATALPVNISGWKINGSNNAGGTSTRFTIPANPITTAFKPGQYYLLVNAGASAGLLALQDATYATGITDDGGIALLTAANVVIDQVGLSSGSAYQESTTLPPLSGSAEQSYERKTAGNAGNCNDTDNNSADFVWNQTSSNPQNSASPPLACIVVTNVTSLTANGTYTAGATINLTVTFSSAVNVTGLPSLLLETGAVDQSAIYSSGSGSNTLTFTYSVVAGDVSGDLDYLATNSLSLNGGTITGAIGDATLILPTPGTVGSLSANNNIVIYNQPPLNVTVDQASTQIDPARVFPVNFSVVFSEPINVGTFTVTDITQSGTAGVITWNITDAGNHMNFTLSATAATGIGTIIPSIVANLVTDVMGNTNTPSTSTDNTVIYDNVPPTVTVNQAAGQADPANATPVNFTVVFSEPINVSTFTASDITQSGTANFITWNIIDSGDHQNFTLSATAVAQTGNLTLIPSIAANRVMDLAGNSNTASTSLDNTVVFNDNVPPTVTINQAVSQPDPASTLPIKFDVIFSEPININVFTVADITQNGTATGITWGITNSGDNKTFTLSATAATGLGTLIPSIAANRVTDVAGNNNLASTSADNSVTYFIPTNTPTATATNTATPAATRTIIISEVAWAGTNADGNDEWIELYNPGSVGVDVSGWALAVNNLSQPLYIAIPLNNVVIPAHSFYLLERRELAVSDIIADQIFSVSLPNTGGIIRLSDISGKIIDTANSNGGVWPAGNSTTKGTMERGALSGNIFPDSDTAWITNTGIVANGKDANGTALKGTPKNLNWAFSVTATASPPPAPTSKPPATPTLKPPPPPPPPPLVAINEFVPRPGHDWNNDGVINVGDEYIEILNHGVIDVNLSGYSLDDEANIGSAPYHLPAVILKPGERIVFYGKETGLLLSDGGDGVRLLKPNGQLMDAYNYTVVKYPDQAYCRIPDNGGLDDWNQNCYPSPGLKNSLSGSFPIPPAQGNAEESVCPISDTLPVNFVWAECPSFGNIWSRFYWDVKGWFGEKVIPNLNSKWDVYVD